MITHAAVASVRAECVANDAATNLRVDSVEESVADVDASLSEFKAIAATTSYVDTKTAAERSFTTSSVAASTSTAKTYTDDAVAGIRAQEIATLEAAKVWLSWDLTAHM